MEKLAKYTLNGTFACLVVISLIGLPLCIMEASFMGSVSSIAFTALLICLIMRMKNSFKCFLAMCIVSGLLQVENGTFTMFNMFVMLGIVSFISALLYVEKRGSKKFEHLLLSPK